MTDYPDDADGDALRHLAAKGIDLSQPRRIEFFCWAANNLRAQEISARLTALGFKCNISEDDEATDDTRFSVYAERVMVPSHHEIVGVQNELNILLEEFDTQCDGWAALIDPSETKSG